MDELRAELRGILGDDNFGQRKVGRSGAPLTEEQGFKAKSRRAQQTSSKAWSSGESMAANVQASFHHIGFSPFASIAPAVHVRLPQTASWWEELARPPANAQHISNTLVRQHAADAYEAEVAAFMLRQKRKHGSDHKMVQRLTEAGTARDRIVALTLQAQESTFHSLPHVRQLLSLAERPRAEIKLAATEALAELFLTRLLPPRTLLPFEKQLLPGDAMEVVAAATVSTLERSSGASGAKYTGGAEFASGANHSSSASGAKCAHGSGDGHGSGSGNGGGVDSGGSSHKSGDLTMRLLMQAHFEDELKEAYARLVGAVESGTHDPLVHVRTRMIGGLYHMLDSKPELERRLLSLLINKLGDPDKKVASRLAHLLGQLCVAHPPMKGVILAETQRFVLRPNVSEASQYYATTFMNRTHRSHRSHPHISLATPEDPPRPLLRTVLVHRLRRDDPHAVRAATRAHSDADLPRALFSACRLGRASRLAHALMPALWPPPYHPLL